MFKLCRNQVLQASTIHYVIMFTDNCGLLILDQDLGVKKVVLYAER